MNDLIKTEVLFIKSLLEFRQYFSISIKKLFLFNKNEKLYIGKYI
jgi:hypothetical protein